MATTGITNLISDDKERMATDPRSRTKIGLKFVSFRQYYAGAKNWTFAENVPAYITPARNCPIEDPPGSPPLPTPAQI